MRPLFDIPKSCIMFQFWTPEVLKPHVSCLLFPVGPDSRNKMEKKSVFGDTLSRGKMRNLLEVGN